ncbi:MAG: hypothetical protein O2795_19745 [Acidobacteria bacterium]|nr:hypothetical protein [Acidobacteriota bacterium]
MIAATGPGVGDSDPGAEQDNADKVGQKSPGESLKRSTLHVLSVSIAADQQAQIVVVMSFMGRIEIICFRLSTWLDILV